MQLTNIYMKYCHWTLAALRAFLNLMIDIPDRIMYNKCITLLHWRKQSADACSAGKLFVKLTGGVKMKKPLKAAAFFAAIVLAAGMPLSPGTSIFSSDPLTAYAAEESYQEGSNGTCAYKKYSDHIEISSFKSTDVDSLTVPDTIDGLPVTAIGIYAGQLCKMKTLTLPDTLKEIGPYCFSNCPNLTTLNIPDSIEQISFRAFEDCTSLETINFPDHLVKTGSFTFENSPWLIAQRKKDPLVIVNGAVIDGRTCTGDVVIPSSVKYVASGTFSRNEKITSCVIPSGVSEITDDMFFYCTSLTSVELKGCTSLGIMTFADCNKLTDIKLSGKLTKIDGYTFSDSTATATITFRGSQSKWNAVEKPSNDAFLQRANMVFDESYQEPDDEVIGDINKDGVCDKKDAVLLQNWLLVKPNTELADWKAGDLDKNGILTGSDLTQLKCILLK